MILLALALAAGAHPHPPALRAPSLSQREKGKAAKPPKGEGDPIDAVARRYGLAGELLVAKGDRITLNRAYGTIAPSGGALHKTGERWRIASVTKQVAAVQIVQRMRWDGASLDDPVNKLAQFKGEGLGTLTMRQLLTHHTGLANPDDTQPNARDVPSFYTAATPDYRYCVSKPPVPGSAFAYNNCDYIVADNHISVSPLHKVDGRWRASQEWPAGMEMAEPDESGVRGYVGCKPEPAFQLASYGAAGGLIGTARAVFAFDRSLMTGKLLPAAARDELWKPEGNGSYQALGAWVFPGKLAGCAAPKRIVQRDGEIWGVQVRNFILPDDDMVVIVFTNRSADDFAIGEVWQGKGFAYDLLSAAACA